MLVVGGHNTVVLGGRQRGWRIRWPAAQSRLRELRQRARSACSVPMEPGSWGLSMKMPCFMDGKGPGRSLSMESACFVDGGDVLVCLSMKVPCFMDKLLSGDGCSGGFIWGEWRVGRGGGQIPGPWPEDGRICRTGWSRTHSRPYRSERNIPRSEVRTRMAPFGLL